MRNWFGVYVWGSLQITYIGMLVFLMIRQSRLAMELRDVKQTGLYVADMLSVWAAQWGEPPEIVKRALEALLRAKPNRGPK